MLSVKSFPDLAEFGFPTLSFMAQMGDTAWVCGGGAVGGHFPCIHASADHGSIRPTKTGTHGLREGWGYLYPSLSRSLNKSTPRRKCRGLFVSLPS